MKKISAIIFALIIFLFSALPAFATRNDRLVDNANLLTSSEEAEVRKVLDSISEEYEYDIVVMTVESVGNKSVALYAADAYENGGYGFDSEISGTILLISMEDRDWYIASTGKGEDILPNPYVISDYFLSYLSNGNYKKAFIEFAEALENEIIDYENGDYYVEDDYVYDDYNYGLVLDDVDEDFPWFTKFLTFGVVGLVIGFVVTSVFKSQLKSVKKCDNAKEYVKKGSFALTENRDLFLYSNVSKIRKPKNTSSGGRSGSSSRSSGRSFSSSSGRSFRGGGGKF